MQRARSTHSVTLVAAEPEPVVLTQTVMPCAAATSPESERERIVTVSCPFPRSVTRAVMGTTRPGVRSSAIDAGVASRTSPVVVTSTVV